MPESRNRQSVVIIGAGFAGYHAAREMSRQAGDGIEITVINSADYFRPRVRRDDPAAHEGRKYV